jgi:hypothetical protein
MWYQAGADVVVVVHLVAVIYPPGLTRGMQIGLGLLVLLVVVIGYRGFARRHPLPHRYAGAVADTVVDTRHDRLPGAGSG